MMHTIESKKFPERGFPHGTDLRIEWVWKQKKVRKTGTTAYGERRPVWIGKVSGVVSRDFDEGKYVWKAHRYDPAGIDGFSEYGEFLVGMTDHQWLRISHMQPKSAKAVLTQDGVVFHCRFPGCERSTTSKISALLHEANDHFGTDLLGEASPKEAKKEVDEKINQIVQVKRRPGRPRVSQ